MTTIYRTRTTFTGHILMPAGGFNYVSAELTLNRVFDYFSHNMYLLLLESKKDQQREIYSQEVSEEG
jgi:hypothetical protein